MNDLVLLFLNTVSCVVLLILIRKKDDLAKYVYLLGIIFKHNKVASNSL